MMKINYEKPKLIEIDCFDATIVHGASGLPPTTCIPTPLSGSIKVPLMLDSKGNPVLYKQD